MAGQTINVSILADTKKFSTAMRNLSKESGLDKLGSAFKTAGSKVVGFFKNGIKLAGAFSLAVAGLALKGGFERALKIEDAQAKLKGLGHSTKAINTIMDSALASVKGTAAGLDDAATMAATAVAAGIKPGQELTKALSLVNDSATIAGVGMSEMGAIFSKIWTSGRAQTTELNQIADRGIPIWAKLAEHYGVSADELRKMVSAGKVDAEAFQQVMTDMVGGAALEAGNTTRGAFANMRAALSRTGEAFLKEIFPLFKTGMGGITGLLDGLTPYAETAGRAFAGFVSRFATGIQGLYEVLAQGDFTGKLRQAFGWEEDSRIVDFLFTLRERTIEVATALRDDIIPAMADLASQIRDRLVPALSEFGDWVTEHKTEIAAVGAALAGFVASFGAVVKIQAAIATIHAIRGAFVALNAAMLANPIALVVAAIGALVGGLVVFFTQTETGRQMWEQIWPRIQEVAQAFTDWFVGTALPVLQSAWEGIQAAAELVVEWFTNTAWPALQAAWQGIQDAATVAADWYLTHVAPVFSAAGELIAAVAEVIRSQFETAMTGLQAVWDTIGGPVMTGIGIAVTILQGIWRTVWGVIATVLKTVWKQIVNAVETGLAVLESVIRAVTAVIRGDWSAAWGHIKDALSRAWDGMRAAVRIAVEALRTIVSEAMNRIRDTMGRVWDQVKSAVGRAWDSVKSTTRTKVDEVVTFVRGIPDRIVAALGNLSSLLSTAGRQVIDGFIGGLRGGFDRVKGELGKLTNLLPSWKGPPAKDRNILRGAGQLVISGFIGGMESQYGAAKRSLTGLTDNLADAVFTGPEPALASAATARPAPEPAPAMSRNDLDYLINGIVSGVGRAQERAVELAHRLDRASGRRQ